MRSQQKLIPIAAALCAVGFGYSLLMHGQQAGLIRSISTPQVGEFPVRPEGSDASEVKRASGAYEAAGSAAAAGNSATQAMGWGGEIIGEVEVELLADPGRKYPNVRREHFHIAGANGGKPIPVTVEMVADHIILNGGAGIGREGLEQGLLPGYTIRKSLRLDGRFLIGFDGRDPVALPRAIEDLAALGEPEPDAYVSASALPDDPRLGEQWGLGDGVGGIEASSGWDRSTGGAGVTVAVIDTGVDYTHPDLAANMWSNPGELGDGKESNGVDDDGNGLIDDWRGWDFVAAGSGDNDPMDDREIEGALIGHGTHVAGIIGAVGNNGAGIAGVAWEVKIMPLKALDHLGRGTWSDIAEALAYAADQGAQISNNAYGTWVAPSSTISAAVEMTRQAGMLFVASAGNGDYPGNGATTGDDLDLYPYYPASFDIENIICVAAHGIGGSLAEFSNLGRAGCDISAPGVDILSTYVGGGYGLLSGTSMSSGFVSGAAAVALAQRPGLGRAGLQSALLAGGARGAEFRGSVRWAAQLDLDGATRIAARPKADRRVAAGDSHLLQVRPDGTVAGWGKAGFVGLGESAGDVSIIATPTTLDPFDDAIGVAAVGFSSYVLNRGGEVWVAGQVRFTSGAPVVGHDDFTLLTTIPGAVGIVGHGALSGDRNENIVVIDDDGGLWVSGSNAHRQLGEAVAAAVPFSDEFFQLAGLPPIVDADVQGGTVFALDDSGALWHWGELPFSATPSRVPGSQPVLATISSDYPEIAQIAAITAVGDAILIDPISGTWEAAPDLRPSARLFSAVGGSGSGGGDYGQVLADGTLGVGELIEVGDVIDAAYTGATGVALRADGASFSWGSKIDGLRGIGFYQFRVGASVLHGLPRSQRAFSSGQGLAVVGRDRVLRGLAFEDSFTRPDSIPDFPLDLNEIVPEGVELLDLAEAISASLLVFSDGSIFGAGENAAGMLGDLPPSTPSYQQITFPGNATAVAAGFSHSLVLDALGEVWAAGDNSMGQLGNGSVGGGLFRRISTISGVTRIASDGFTRSFALDGSGRLWVWGDDKFFAPVRFPIPVVGGDEPGSALVDFASGDFVSGGSQELAVATADGRILIYSDLSALPALVPPSVQLDLPGVTSIALGTEHGMATTAAGDVFSWGDNSAGQLGLGSFDPPLGPPLVKVPGIGRISGVLAHGRSSFAVGLDGRLWRWGEDVDLNNLLGQDRATQTLAVGLSNVVFDSGNPGDDWWTTHFSEEQLSDDEVSGNESDPDSDSISNLLEYALGTEPFEEDKLADLLEFAIEEIPDGGEGSDAGPSVNSLTGGQLHGVLRLRRQSKRSDIDYVFEVSDDLIHWRSGEDEFFIAVDNPVSLVVYDLQPVDLARGPRYYRLVIRFKNF